jgi:hypothetical protein
LLLLTVAGTGVSVMQAIGRVDLWFAPIVYIAFAAIALSRFRTSSRTPVAKLWTLLTLFSFGGIAAIAGGVVLGEKWLIHLAIALGIGAWCSFFAAGEKWHFAIANFLIVFATVPFPVLFNSSLLQLTNQVVVFSAGCVLDVVGIPNMATVESLSLRDGTIDTATWWSHAFNLRLAVAASLFVGLLKTRPAFTMATAVFLSIVWFWGIKSLFLIIMVLVIQLGGSLDNTAIQWIFLLGTGVVVLATILMNDWFSKLFCHHEPSEQARAVMP